MNFLRLAFYAIIAFWGVYLLSILLEYSILLLTTNPKRAMNLLYQAVQLQKWSAYFSFFYGIAPGYILWRIGERKGLVWGSFIYLFSWAFLLHYYKALGTQNIALYARIWVLVYIPYMFTYIVWLMVKKEPFRRLYIWLGTQSLVLIIGLFIAMQIFIRSKNILSSFAMTIIPVLLPIPIAAIIQKARHWFAEEKQMMEQLESLKT